MCSRGAGSSPVRSRNAEALFPSCRCEDVRQAETSARWMLGEESRKVGRFALLCWPGWVMSAGSASPTSASSVPGADDAPGTYRHGRGSHRADDASAASSSARPPRAVRTSLKWTSRAGYALVGGTQEHPDRPAQASPRPGECAPCGGLALGLGVPAARTGLCRACCPPTIRATSNWASPERTRPLQRPCAQPREPRSRVVG